MFAMISDKNNAEFFAESVASMNFSTLVYSLGIGGLTAISMQLFYYRSYLKLQFKIQPGHKIGIVFGLFLIVFAVLQAAFFNFVYVSVKAESVGISQYSISMLLGLALLQIGTLMIGLTHWSWRWRITFIAIQLTLAFDALQWTDVLLSTGLAGNWMYTQIGYFLVCIWIGMLSIYEWRAGISRDWMHFLSVTIFVCTFAFSAIHSLFRNFPQNIRNR